MSAAVDPRRVAGGVGELGRVGHPLDGVDDLVGWRCWRIEVRTCLYSAASSRARPVGAGSVEGLGLDPQRRAGTGDAGADAGRLDGAEDGGGLAARAGARSG